MNLDQEQTWANEPLKLIPDLPQFEGDEENPFEPYKDTLCRVIYGTPPPFTLGVFGDWGAGCCETTKEGRRSAGEPGPSAARRCAAPDPAR